MIIFEIMEYFKNIAYDYSHHIKKQSKKRDEIMQ